ncbi:ankyrin repeat and SAM domain-containing protein 1A-like isoform X2 [Gigantopelta aegis]|uniref:ankyrin repeat and SAM domain-containing protein 1A-like isoform X2 n=1 Tax=Gigantopelta aegis TaxID=1735272 RepID=UPI001B88888A|nr:ankyrin repeat and SAM domain-containing protein 1A-like isoform X2 [Gigantopelta aegis]
MYKYRMGRDQELLEAARTGNIQQLEKLLSSKSRKPSGEKGALTSAFERFHNFPGFGSRLANIQCVDSSGETPLHLAALNGHKDFVQILLQNEASTNVTDDKGCTPLHLAAWNGRSDICTLLLQPSASPAQVNAQNISGDTALHCAAQHGHCGTVSVLLQDKADPTIRNLASDSPLDFAAQFGRGDVVKQLLTTHPNLAKCSLSDHSPLHRAARAGHTSIVKYMLEAGFSINMKTDGGSPLHEASRYCKIDVIKLLLEKGVDVMEKDKSGLNAMEILSVLPSQKAYEAVQLIKEHIKQNAILCPIDDRTPSEDEYPESFSDNPSPVRPVPAPRTSIVADQSTKIDPIYSLEVAPRVTVQSPDISPPPIPPREPSFIETRQTPVVSVEDDDVYDVPAHLSPSVPLGSSPDDIYSEPPSNAPIPTKKPQKPPRASKAISMAVQPKPHISTAPKSDSDPVPNRVPDSDPVKNLVPDSDPVTNPVPDSDPVINPDPDSDRDPSKPAEPGYEEDEELYINMSAVVLDAPKPVRKSHYVNVSLTTQEDGDVQMDLDQRTSEQKEHADDVEVKKERDADDEDHKEHVTESEVKKELDLEEQSDADRSVKDGTETQAEHAEDNQMKKEHEPSMDVQKEQVCSKVQTAGETISADTGDLPADVSVTVDQKIPDTKPAPETTEKAQKPSSLPLDVKRTSVVGEDVPLSPSSYVQPPTPDHPPPSPMTAVSGITLKINPQEKRKSKDMETLTESYLLVDGTVKLTDKDPQLMEPDTEILCNEKPDLPNPVNIPDSAESPLVKVERVHSQILETVPEKVEETVNHSSQAKEEGDNSSSPKSLPVECQLRGGDAEVDSMYAGLLRGSTPGGSRNVVSQICEKVAVRHVKSNQRSTLSAVFTFDPVMEREEDKEIDPEDVLRAIDAIEATAQNAAKHAAEKKHDDSSAFDDTEEWAKIEATLQGFGAAMTRESIFVREYEDDFKRLLAASANSKMQSVGDWLDRLGLGQYENTLVANGYDDTDFLGGKVLEDGDLESIGIKDAKHRKKILEAAKNLPKITPIDQDRLVISVKDWLASLRLDHYRDTLHSHKYNTMQRVIKLWELELSTVLDITSIGHRKRILESLGNRPPPEKKDSSSSSPALIKREVHEPQEVKNIPDLFKDYTGVKSTAVDEGEVPIPTQKPLLMFEKNEEFINGQGQHIRDSAIHIRPPHLAHTTGSVRQWRHRPEILIKGCCNYTAQYLGSTLVKDLNGPGSTQEGISKLKKSSDVIAKIPTIMLSISYKGVKFIDAKSKRVICDHEIANIFCACQDAEHLNFFAYITKDRETEKHYCHVFSVRSRELAGEIILTLGEAFEIAYQMALKEKAEEDALDFERKLSQNDPDDTTSLSSKASVSTT